MNYKNYKEIKEIGKMNEEEDKDLIKFSRRLEIEKQFVEFCRKETEKLHKIGQIPSNASLTTSASSFITWLMSTKEGNMVLKELCEVAVKINKEKNSD